MDTQDPKFVRWVRMHDNTGGFFDPALQKNVKYQNLTPAGKQTAQTTYLKSIGQIAGSVNKKFMRWIESQEKTSGFFEPRLNKKVRYYATLSDEGKRIAKEEFLALEKATAHKRLKTKAMQGNKSAISKIIKQTKDFFAFKDQINKLECLDLSEADLKQSSIENMVLKGFIFNNSVLCWSRFNNSTLIDCSFKKSSLEGSLFTNVTFKGCCDFTEAKLDYVDLSGADLRNAKLENASMLEANLSGADLRGLNLSQVKTSRLYLKDAKIDAKTIAPPHISKIDTFLKHTLDFLKTHLESRENIESALAYIKKHTPEQKNEIKKLKLKLKNLEADGEVRVKKLLKKIIEFKKRNDFMLFYGIKINSIYHQLLQELDWTTKLKNKTKKKYEEFMRNRKKQINNLLRNYLGMKRAHIISENPALNKEDILKKMESIIGEDKP